MKKTISVFLIFLLILVLVFPASAETEKTVPGKTYVETGVSLPYDFPHNSGKSPGIGIETNVTVLNFTDRPGKNIRNEVSKPLKGEFSDLVIRTLGAEKAAETLVYVPADRARNITDLAYKAVAGVANPHSYTYFQAS